MLYMFLYWVTLMPSTTLLIHFALLIASSGIDCGGSEVSDGGYWSGDHGNNSPAPSPPIAESDRALVPSVDEGLDMEMENVLFDEPAPRKRKVSAHIQTFLYGPCVVFFVKLSEAKTVKFFKQNSVKMAYRCLWPNCGKILTSIVGIKRHVRTLHLG